MRGCKFWVVLLVAWGSIARAQTTAPADPPPGVTRVACVGDSITYGHGIEDRPHNSYPARLGSLLGEKFDVRNYGVNGTTALKTGDRPYVDRPLFNKALAYKPDVLIVGLGTNDTKPQNWVKADKFVEDYEAIIAAFKNVNPGLKVYVILPVPCFYPGKSSIRDRVLKDEVIPKLKSIATDVGATTIDLRAALDGRKELFPDTIHPNAEGAKLMTDAVAKVVQGK